MGASEPEYIFDEAQIGKGLKPLAQHGCVIIDRGTLTLLGTKRDTIASAPLSAVSARKFPMSRGQALSLKVNGEKFNVSPGWGRYAGTFILPGDTKPVKNAAEALLKLIELGGGAV